MNTLFRSLLVLSVHLLCLTVFALRVHAAEPTPKATDDAMPPLVTAILGQVAENPDDFAAGTCPAPKNDEVPAVVNAIEGTMDQLEFSDYSWGVAKVANKPVIWLACYRAGESAPIVAWVGGIDPKMAADALGRKLVAGGLPLPLNGEYGDLGATVAPMIDILPGVSNVRACR